MQIRSGCISSRFETSVFLGKTVERICYTADWNEVCTIVQNLASLQMLEKLPVLVRHFRIM